ncbi:MAG: hypothetical protein J5955_06510 [Bacilli bacterium]|nr:hypothetical protein [Bacilli bacterium]
MATSTITSEYKIDDKKAAKRVSSVFDADIKSTNPSNCERVEDKDVLLKILKKY